MPPLNFTVFAELQNSGLNAVTITLIITILFTFFQGLSLVKQNNKINKTGSEKSVSFCFYAYLCFSSLALFFYGLDKQALSIAINGLLGLPAFLILISIIRIRRLNGREIFIALGSIATIPIMILSQNKDVIFLMIGFVLGLFVIKQILKIWKNKSAGAYHPAQIFVNIGISSFWIIYAFLVNIQPVKITNGFLIILWGFLLFSYFKFKEEGVLLEEDLK